MTPVILQVQWSAKTSADIARFFNHGNFVFSKLKYVEINFISENKSVKKYLLEIYKVQAQFEGNNQTHAL